MDYMIRAIAADGQIRAFAATTKETVEFARQAHNTSPVVTAALGRLLTGGAMMGYMMKSEQDLLTLQVNAGGPMKGMTVTADNQGHVKGFAKVPDVVLPANEKGKLDVAGAVGIGVLQVIKDLGLKEPYVGSVALQTSEIAEDLTYYFTISEQTPSAVGLGVLMSKDNTVKQAGGFILQLMPFAEEKTIDALEKKLAEITSVTAMFEEGLTPETILEKILGELGLEITDQQEIAFKCNCSKERVGKALASIQKEDIQEMIDDGKPIEVNCHFCNTNYEFDVEELKAILESRK